MRGRMDRYGEPIERERLVAAAWPDEPRLVPSAAANRLKVAIASLRKFGLEPLIVAVRGGSYFIKPDVPIRIDEALALYPIAPRFTGVRSSPSS